MPFGQDTVRAAGGVLWRVAPGGRREVAIVHRPKYDDWSLPKGKLEGAETFSEAAVREVHEETGFAPALGTRLIDVRYRRRGRPKVVRYWAMRATSGAFTPTAEIDELRWLPLRAAIRCVTHATDRAVLEVFRRLVEDRAWTPREQQGSER